MARASLQQLLWRLHQAKHSAVGGGLSDGQLLERFAEYSDEGAFELLLWRHGPMILGVCRRLLRQEQDAEDAFQATFLVLARKAGSIGKRESVAAWLYQVASRVALNARANAVKRSGHERPWREMGYAGDELGQRELRSVLDEEVRRLPAKYRTAFVLCQLEGLTNEEAAKQLGCPTGTVLSRLSRARERLRHTLTRRGITLSATALAAGVSESGKAAVVSTDLMMTTLDVARAVVAGAEVTAVAGNSVAALTNGVIPTMFFSKLRVALAAVLIVGLTGVGVGARTLWGPGEPQLTLAGEGGGSAPGPAEAVKRAALLAQTHRNLKAIGLALHNYHDSYGHFPTPAISSSGGKPLLSWRVALLPYLDQDNLFRRFKLDQPWDSPDNRALLREIPDVYAPAGPGRHEQGQTYYLAVVGKGAAFEPFVKVRLVDILDGTSNTIGVAEAAQLVPWTKPEDLEYAADKPLPSFGSLVDGEFNALFMDGSVRRFARTVDEQALRHALTRAGQEVIDFAKLTTPASTAGPGVAVDAKRLAGDNAVLKLAVEMTAKEVVKLRSEIETLSAQVRLQSAGAGEKTQRLVKENEDLLRQLGQVLAELDKLKAQKQELEHVLRKN